MYTSHVLFSLYNNYCIFLILCIIPHTHTQVLHGANPVLWDPKRTVRWNQDRQREQGGVEWGGYGMLDHTVHPLLHTYCNTYADQQRIRELTKQLREMVGREELPVYLCAL